MLGRRSRNWGRAEPRWSVAPSPAALMSVAPVPRLLMSAGQGEGSLAQPSNHPSSKLCSCPLESGVLCECSLLNELIKSI